MLTLLLFACATETHHASGPVDAAATLAAADAHDGQTDKIVHECAMCGLGMAGDPAHSATHEGYTLHFCSDSDRQAWEKDVPAGMERMQRALAQAH